jgi:hypothetical protein
MASAQQLRPPPIALYEGSLYGDVARKKRYLKRLIQKSATGFIPISGLAARPEGISAIMDKNADLASRFVLASQWVIVLRLKTARARSFPCAPATPPKLQAPYVVRRSPHRRFARHAPPPRINPTTESPLASPAKSALGAK